MVLAILSLPRAQAKKKGVEVWIDFYEVQEQCGNYMREPEIGLEERSSRLFVVRRSAEEVTEQFGANTFVIYDGAYRLLDKGTGPIHIDDIPSQIREFMERTQEDLDQGIKEGIYQMDAD